MAPKITEEQHQEQLCQWWAWACKKYKKPQRLLFHPPSEGVRSVIFAARLKKVGWRAGFPDLQFLVPSERYHGLFIEMKALHGKPTKEQLETLSDLRTQGYAACLCYGFDAAKRCIEDYLDGREIPEKM